MKSINLKRFIGTVIILLLVVAPGAGCEYLPSLDFGTPIPAPPATPPSAEPISPTTPPEPINPSYTIPAPTATIAPPSATALPPPIASPPALPSIADVVAKVRPSVVAISTEMVAFDIFRRPITQQGAGSGWVIDKDGLIVTNNHVVEDAQTVTVTLGDKSFTAETVRRDPVTDLAVLKITADNLIPIQMGDSTRLRVGDWVVAIGNALGRGISAKEGIISRIGVSVNVDQGQTLYDLMETSAAINPGNSGGPLVNMAGEVIGITSAKLAAIGVEGMGYAISVDSAKPVIQDLIQKGLVVRPWLGISASTVNELVATRYDLAVKKGALLNQVVPNSPADKAGLKANDVIVSYGDKEIASIDELVRAIQTSRVGQQVQLTFWRDKTKNVAIATLAESPK